MRSIPILALFLITGALPANAQDASAPPAPKVISSDTCIFGAAADAQQVAGAKTVTIVKCKLTAPRIPDASVNAALRSNPTTKAVNGLSPGNVLATTASGSNVTIYVNDDGN